MAANARRVYVPEHHTEYELTQYGELIDGDGTVWTTEGYTLANGEGDTFGPNHPHIPAIIKALRDPQR